MSIIEEEKGFFLAVVLLLQDQTGRQFVPQFCRKFN